ncbi:hypothetical protein D3C86_1287710 [compost metagenome]
MTWGASAELTASMGSTSPATLVVIMELRLLSWASVTPGLNWLTWRRAPASVTVPLLSLQKAPPAAVVRGMAPKPAALRR